MKKILSILSLCSILLGCATTTADGTNDYAMIGFATIAAEISVHHELLSDAPAAIQSVQPETASGQ